MTLREDTVEVTISYHRHALSGSAVRPRRAMRSL
jgi:hypothetical protein